MRNIGGAFFLQNQIGKNPKIGPSLGKLRVIRDDRVLGLN